MRRTMRRHRLAYVLRTMRSAPPCGHLPAAKKAAAYATALLYFTFSRFGNPQFSNRCLQNFCSLCCNVAKVNQCFSAEHRTAGRAAQGVVRQADELVIIYRILAESADGNAHAALVVYIQCNLRTVVLFQILDKLLRCAGQVLLDRKSVV